MTVRTLASDRQVTRIGPGALDEVGTLATRQGIGRVLVVTDAGMARTPWLTATLGALRAAGLEVSTFKDVTATPRVEDVRGALGALLAGDCDGVVSLGGGSSHDVAKVAAVMARSTATFHELAHGLKEPGGKLPHVAVNTTAGTGAERSGYAFIMEGAGHEHSVLHHALLVPEVAVLDPRLHATMPAGLTAATGLNALAHAVEAFLSEAHTPGSDEDALAAIRAIREQLPAAVARGDDLEVREAMAEAAYRAAVAFDAAGLGLVDSISLVLSALFSVDQGTANAILLPYVMQYDAWSVEPERLAALAAALGAAPADGEGVMESAVRAVLELKAEVGVSGSLADRGLSWDDLYLVRHAILRHPFTRRNPRPLDEEGLAEIFLSAVEGVPTPTPQG